jgi:hypothetical protein
VTGWYIGIGVVLVFILLVIRRYRRTDKPEPPRVELTEYVFVGDRALKLCELWDDIQLQEPNAGRSESFRFWTQVIRYFDESGVVRGYVSVLEQEEQHVVFRLASKALEDYVDVPDERIDRTVINMDEAIDEYAQHHEEPA